MRLIPVRDLPPDSEGHFLFGKHSTIRLQPILCLLLLRQEIHPDMDFEGGGW